MSECNRCGREIPDESGLTNYCGEFCKVKDGEGARTIYD